MHFEWETLDAQTQRVMVPGGWLVCYHSRSGAASMSVVPDAKHLWEVEVTPERITEARERLAVLESEVKDPYREDAIRAELREELANLQRFLAQHL